MYYVMKKSSVFTDVVYKDKSFKKAKEELNNITCNGKRIYDRHIRYYVVMLKGRRELKNYLIANNP